MRSNCCATDWEAREYVAQRKAVLDERSAALDAREAALNNLETAMERTRQQALRMMATVKLEREDAASVLLESRESAKIHLYHAKKDAADIKQAAAAAVDAAQRELHDAQALHQSAKKTVKHAEEVASGIIAEAELLLAEARNEAVAVVEMAKDAAVEVGSKRQLESVAAMKPETYTKRFCAGV
jgi:hypothetical protein